MNTHSAPSRRSSLVSPSFVMSKNGDKSYEDDDKDHAHLLYAQKLNNNAAMCIEIGYYERAIQSLKKALKFSEKRSDESLKHACRCDGCKADGCIDFADDFASNKLTQHSGMPVASSDEESSDDEDEYVPKTAAGNDKGALILKSISQPRIQRILPIERNGSRGGKGENASWGTKDEYCDDEEDLKKYKKALKFSEKRSDERLTQHSGMPVASRSTRGNDDEESSDYEDECVPETAAGNDKCAFIIKSISQPRVQKISPDERNVSKVGKGENASWNIKDEYCDDEDLEEEYKSRDDEIYKRPIRVSREGHPMGSSLFLIITFNLALAHHLEVATTYNDKSYNPKSTKKALLFYELSSAYESNLLADSNKYWRSISSVRFNTILNNNLNQVRPMLPDKCLPAFHQLLSNVSDAIDKGTEQLSARTNRESKSSSRKSKSSGGSLKSSSGRSSLSHSKSSSSSRSSKPSSISSNKLQLALGGMALIKERRRSSCCSTTSGTSGTSGSYY